MSAVLLQGKRQEFLNALIAVRPSNRFKVVVVDKRSLQVINKALKLAEILEHDVVRIEKIENNRKEDPDTEALYFLTPSKQSVGHLINDLATAAQQPPARAHGRGMDPAPTPTRKQPKYKAAHVYFTSELPNALLNLIKSSRITPHIRALKELCIEYDVHGQGVFLTKLIDYPMYRMYSPIASRGFNDELELISKKLANVCGALRENPAVRYLLLDPDTHGDTKARPLAFLFHTEMERIRETLPNGGASDGGPQTELIIVDRCADPFAPILHEFTYEAMVYDLLEIEDGNKYSYVVELASGEKEMKTMVLDENDSIWQEFRFQHISDAQQGLLAKSQSFVGANKAIADMQAGQKLNLRTMRDVVSNMPQFSDQMALISVHIDIMQKCMDAFKARCLADLGVLEQNLVMGTTPDGVKYTAGDVDVADVLHNPQIEPRDKLRLLLLFFIANPSLVDTERQKLAHLAKLSREARETIKGMGMVIRWAHALDLLKQVKQKPGQVAKSTSKWSLAGIRGATGDNQDNEGENSYDVSRYTPGLKNVLERSIEGNLSEELFPYVVPPERPRDSNPFANTGSSRSTPGLGASGEGAGSTASSMWTSLASSVGLQTQETRPLSGGMAGAGAGAGAGNASRPIKSLRSARPTWQKRDSSPAVSTGSGYATPAGGASGLSPSGAGSVSPLAGAGGSGQRPRQQSARPRVILFVLGGVTMSEIRAADEISRKFDREVLIGSTHLIEPEGYLKDISSLTFELVGENGCPIDLKPSYYALGYGGPPTHDPMSHFDEELYKQKPKLKQLPAPDEAPEPRRGPEHSRRDSPSREHRREHRRERSSSRGRSSSRNPREREHSDRYDGRSGDMRSAGRVDGYPSNSSGSSMRSSSGAHGYADAPMRSAGASREHFDTGSSRGGYSRHDGDYSSREAGSRDRSSPTRHRNYERPEQSQNRNERPSYGEPQNFRAGYDEYRQQQQQQQQLAARSKSLHSSSSSSSYHARSSPHSQHQQQHYQPPPPRPQMTKEQIFREKFEKSQSEWNAQKMGSGQISASNIPDMHKVSLNSSSGRGRSGSSASGEKKPSFLKRYL
ncbi:syntaxin binding protein 1 [Coemansia sp. Benny D115]|nr:syntaxin binding protein 1 [Coemansia sp. Benny D115]